MKVVLDQESLAKAFGWRTAVGGLFRTFPGFIIGNFDSHVVYTENKINNKIMNYL